MGELNKLVRAIINGFALSLTSLVMTGCAATHAGGGLPATIPAGRVWVNEDIGGRGIIDNSRVTLMLDGEGRVSGRSGCNQYSGRYSVAGEKIGISQIVGTMMACAPALMEQESRFLDILGRIATWRIEPTGSLIISTQDGATLRFFPESS